nr:immunoglobulin light chain junction region [Macaca mulatta]MOX22735.1 immunoglobulin light chain junction region [Macaca mulatta]
DYYYCSYTCNTTFVF